MTRLAIAVVSLGSAIVVGAAGAACTACTGEERVQKPVTNTAAPAATPSPVPAGWVPIQPSEERRRCANYSRDEWQISVNGGAVFFQPYFKLIGGMLAADAARNGVDDH